LLGDPRVQEFHRTVARRFAEVGILRLHLLRLNDQPVSAFYGFKCDRTTFFYLSGFDSEFASYSVGSVILEFSVHQAIAERCSAFNFLRGREAYKYKWGAHDTPCYRRNLETGRQVGANCLRDSSRAASVAGSQNSSATITQPGCC
jgi:CelD/BcsL family acetyltransferase involved in cellulose biosynthesis